MKANCNSKENVIIIGGGVGPMAGVDLHRLIIENTPTDGTDQDHLRVLHISFSDLIEDRTESLKERTFGLPAAHMARLIEQAMEFVLAYGCRGIAAVPCNTFHAEPIFNEFARYLDHFGDTLSIINMIEETAEEIASSVPAGSEVAIISTTGTRESKLYENALKKRELVAVYPEDQVLIHQAIYNETWGIKAASGKTVENQEILYSAIEQLYQSRVSAIILACTEIPLVIREDRYKGIPLINPVDILSRAVIKASCTI